MPRVRKLTYLENEQYILEKIITTTSSYNCPEFTLLDDHIKRGGGISDLDYFYKKIESIASFKYHRGCNLVYNFCRRVLRGRLPREVERVVFPIFWKNWRNAKIGYKYAKYVVRGKLEEELEVGCKSLDYVLHLRSSNLPFEEVLMKSPSLCYYFYRNLFYLPDMVHNSMIAHKMIGDRDAICYFKFRKRDDMILKNRLSVVDGSKTVKEFLESL